jgi:NitT/TauT family transport system substrate-binding protein
VGRTIQSLRRRSWKTIRLFAVLLPILAPMLASPARAAEPVRVGVIGLIADAGIYVAAEKGYFREAGLDVKLEPFSSSVKMIPVLANGQLEVATGGIAASLFNGAAQGLPILVVADKGSTSESMGTNVLLVAKGAWDRGEVRSIKDLKGKPVGLLGPGALSEYQLARYLEREGLGLQDVQTKYMSFPNAITALGAGSLAAAISSEPLATYGVRRGAAVKFLEWHKVQPHHQAGVIFYNTEFARKRGEAARGFMVAYVRGIRFYHDALRAGAAKKEELIRILMAHTDAKERDVYNEATWTGLNPDGAALIQSIADQQQFFVKLGRVEKPVPIEKLVDNSFAEHAVKVMGPYRP